MRQATAAAQLTLALPLLCGLQPAGAAPRLRIMPPAGTTLAAGQRFDVRVEAAPGAGETDAGELRVFLDGRPLAPRGEPRPGADPAARHFLHRELSLDRPGEHVLSATAGAARAEVRFSVGAWARGGRGRPRARNVILLLGDGLGAAHRTAARIVSRGYANGKARTALAMDTLPVTGQVMTAALNAVITDSAPGMSAYVTGAKGDNGQIGVFPDDTPDPFDNPRVEYLGEILRRTRGPGFQIGLVTTADLTDATPAGNAVHCADRRALRQIARAYFDERERTGLAVLLGGGGARFAPQPQGDADDLARAFEQAGWARIDSAGALKAALGQPVAPRRILGLFHPLDMTTAFDKVGAGRYSDELAQEHNAALRDQPMLDDMARLALRTLSEHSPAGFYLLIEGASIDKRAHSADAERTIWDTIEFDNAVAVALQFARATNADGDRDNDTLVLVTADHECGGMSPLGVGRERYAPSRLGLAVRDYAGLGDLVPAYDVDAAGFPLHPDPERKLLLGWAAAPDRHENWLSNRRPLPAAVRRPPDGPDGTIQPHAVAGANPGRDGPAGDSENRSVEGRSVPGFLVPGVIENGERSCTPEEGCPAGSSSLPQAYAGHTATDVPLSAEGPGAWQFTGTYDNSDVLLKILRSTSGACGPPGDR
jgi:alkaline phosphatase